MSAIESTDSLNPRPGLRRRVAPNAAADDRSMWKRAWAAIHHDGSVSIAAAIGGHRKTSDEYWAGHEIESTGIESAVADFMGLDRSVAEHLEIDEYETRIGIEWSGTEPLLIYNRDQSGFTYTAYRPPRHGVRSDDQR